MPVPSNITDLSATAGSNYPAGSDSPATLDDVQRAHASFIRQIYDYVVASFTFPGGTSSAPTTEGVAYWNTTTNKLTVGDGAAAKVMVDRDSTESLSAKTLVAPTITGYTETAYVPSAGSAFTVDLANGTIQKLTTNANVTITLPAPAAGKSYTLLVAYGGTHTLTWAGGGTIRWAGGSAPTATSVNGKVDTFTFWSVDGTDTFASAGGLNA